MNRKKQIFGLLGCFILCAFFLLLACSSKKTDVSVEQPAESTPPVDVLTPISEPIIPDPILPSPVTSAVPGVLGDMLVVADFNAGEKPNNLGGDFGAWDKDPEDTTQTCTISFEDDDALENSSGYSMRLDYDVDSENPAYNGFWMKLDGLNAERYNTVSFYVRGQGYKNFTKRIKIEMKDSSNTTAPYIINGITDSWQKFQIPFERFRKIHDWSDMNEFVLVFDDMNSDPKQGTLLIDQIAFEKK